MLKKILTVLFCILILQTAGIAGTPDSDKKDSSTVLSASELLEKVKFHRNSIYNSLELTNEQLTQINKIDQKFYVQVEPELQKLVLLTKKTQEIANSGNCTKKDINAVKKEFKTVQKEMNCIKNEYDKEFRSVLSFKQKSKYRVVRKQKRAEMKKEFERQRALQKNQ